MLEVVMSGTFRPIVFGCDCRLNVPKLKITSQCKPVQKFKCLKHGSFQWRIWLCQVFYGHRRRIQHYWEPTNTLNDLLCPYCALYTCNNLPWQYHDKHLHKAPTSTLAGFVWTASEQLHVRMSTPPSLVSGLHKVVSIKISSCFIFLYLSPSFTAGDPCNLKPHDKWKTTK